MRLIVEQTSPLAMKCPHAQRAVAFLREIGLSVEISPGAKGFVNHISIVKGTLRVDPRCPVSRLLHESGHLAVTPSRYREWMDGNLYTSLNRMLDDPDFLAAEPDSPLYRAVIQASDPEVTAWSYAAGVALGIPPEKIIQNREYDGAGKAIRLALMGHSYVGINGLAFAGFCVRRKSEYNPLPEYPELAFWLQP